VAKRKRPNLKLTWRCCRDLAQSSQRRAAGSDSGIVYLVHLISIWYCNWFMLFMTLDMPDEGTR
jgi:hypothetical protein